MKRTLLALLGCLVCVNAQSALAEPLLRYSQAEVGYRYTDPDPGNKLNGVYADLSFSPAKYLFLKGKYAYDSSSDGNADTFQYGGGAYAPLNDKVHLVLNVGGERGVNHFDQIDGDTINRVYVGPELRAQIHPNVEVDVGYTWVGGQGDATSNYNLGLLFALNNSLALSLGVVFLDQDADQGYGGLRYAF